MDTSTLKSALVQAGIDVASFKSYPELVASLAPDIFDEKNTAFMDAAPMYTLAAPRREVVRLWERLMGLRLVTGCYPVIIGEQEHALLIYEWQERAVSPKVVLAKAAKIDARQYLDHEWESYGLYDPEPLPELEGTWNPPQHSAQIPDALTSIEKVLAHPPGLPHIVADVETPYYVALVDTINSWEVPAYLSFGDWNACPPPQNHVALHQHWHERFGVEIVFAAHDTIMCRVARPPATETEAMALARDQMMYCEDIVTQGVDTIAALAGSLLDDPMWFFWWD
jgi:hypothetical protein